MADGGAALAGLTLCASDIHRSFWLYVHHPALFTRAYDFSFGAAWATDAAIRSWLETPTERFGYQSDSVASGHLGLLQAQNSNAATAAWRAGAQPRACSLLSVHVRDNAMLRWSSRLDLKRRVGNPNIHGAGIRQSPPVSCARWCAAAQSRYQQMLVEAFASMCWA